MIPGIQEIKALAIKYSKKQLASMAQTGLIDPQKAVMAGMMRDRIAKEDMQPPTTTVAQDTLGIAPPPQMGQMGQMPPAPQGPQMPPQMAQAQPQMPPPQMGAPAQQPPVMAASGGVTSLPVDIADYAGGGIVAFAGEGPSLVEDEYGFGPYKVFPGLDRFISSTPFGSRYETPAQIQARLKKEAEQKAAGVLPAPQISDTAVSSAPPITGPNYVAPPPPPPAPKDKRGTTGEQRGQGSAPPPPPGVSPNARGATGLQPPVLPPFDPNAIKLTGGKYDLPTINKLADITKEREAAEAAAGYNKNLTEEQLKRMEGKKGELADLRSRAGGEALMQFGLGLIGARKGEEGQKASESGKAALASYKGDVKELRSAQERLEERADALRMADNQAKKTNSAADIAKRDMQQAKYEAAQLKVYEVENELAKTGAMISSQTRGQDVQAKTNVFQAQLAAQTAREGHQVQRDIAGMQAQTSREYTSALKAQGLQDSQIKNIMGTASEIYKAILSKNPTADEATSWNAALRQASQGYAQVAPMVGKNMPGVPLPPAAVPTADFYKNTFGITPTR